MKSLQSFMDRPLIGQLKKEQPLQGPWQWQACDKH
jgi:hypothetical protein